MFVVVAVVCALISKVAGMGWVAACITAVVIAACALFAWVRAGGARR